MSATLAFVDRLKRHVIGESLVRRNPFYYDRACRLLERLDSPGLRDVALRKVEGYGNEEIAAQLGCGLRTVERRLRLIRSIWEQEEAS